MPQTIDNKVQDIQMSVCECMTRFAHTHTHTNMFACVKDINKMKRSQKKNEAQRNNK